MDFYKARLNNGKDITLGVPMDVNNILLGNKRCELVKYFNETLGQNIVCSVKYLFSINDGKGKVS